MKVETAKQVQEVQKKLDGVETAQEAKAPAGGAADGAAKAAAA